MNFRKEPNETRTCSTAASEEGIPVLPLEQCLAKTQDDDKPGCTVLEHLIWVGKIAEALWERLAPGVRELLPKNVVVALAALHDIGKISPGFQRKIWGYVKSDFRNEEVRLLLGYVREVLDLDKSTNHSLIGEKFLRGKIKDWSKKDWSKVIGRHHGFESGNVFESSDAFIFGGEVWQELRQKAFDEVSVKLNISLDDFPKADKDALNLATGFVVVADWLGSDERFCVDGKVPDAEIASKRACEILDEIGWITPTPLENKSFDELFRNEAAQAEFTPNETQRAFYDVAKEPGVYVIEAPTGLGKTEAALFGAYRLAREGNAGVYFALPTRTTSDKIHERVVPFIERAFSGAFDVRRTHGLTWTYFSNVRSENKIERGRGREGDRKNFYVGDDWFRPSKRALLQTFGVGTIDQSLMGVLPVKHNFLRLFGLAGKVVVFDEAHSYDRYTGALLDNLIQRLEKAGATVIVLSATLTRERRARLLGKNVPETKTQDVEETSKEPYPLISYRYYSDKLKQIANVSSIAPPPDRVVELEALERDPNRVAQLAVENAERGALVLCVTNTVDKARELYKLVLATNASVSVERIGLLHSRFPGVVREDLEKRFLDMFGKDGDRSQGAILVSTQVVEQSVDIDADLLITDLAPTDMLIQRIGRLWRHKRENRPVPTARAFIVYPPEGKESFKERLGVDGIVYQPYVLWRTAEVWRDRKQFVAPGEVRNLLESTYAAREESGEVETMKEEVEKKTEKMLATAKVSMSGTLPIVSDKTTFLTRYDDAETLDVLIVRNVQMAPVPSVTPLYGETIRSYGEAIRLDGYRRLVDAVSLCRNTISRRKRFCDRELIRKFRGSELYKPLVESYFRYSENFVLLQLEPSGILSTMDGDETDLRYTEQLGLFEERSTPSRNEKETTRVVEYEEEEEEEGDDEYYEDFEW